MSARSSSRSKRSDPSRPAREVDAIAGGDQRLGSLMRAAQACLAMNRRLADVFPDTATRREIAIARIDGDCLVIAAASPARATQALLLAETLRQRADALWPQPIRRTRVVVIPGFQLEPDDG